MEIVGYVILGLMFLLLAFISFAPALQEWYLNHIKDRKPDDWDKLGYS